MMLNTIFSKACKCSCLEPRDYHYKVGMAGQEIPQSHTADQTTAPRERATEH